MADLRLVIVGGGNMGFALGSSVLKQGAISPENLTIIERREVRREELRGGLHCSVVAPGGEVPPGPEVILLAVKPADLAGACAEVQALLHRDALVISVMAGITLSRLSQSLSGHRYVIRAMPNTPAQIGAGVTVYTWLSEVTPSQRAQAQRLFSSAGFALAVENEDLLDGATALSGSGPGFVYYLIEHFLEAGERLGFSKEESKSIVLHTFLGSLKLWQERKGEVSNLRSEVTSPNGTTLAGLKEFDALHVGDGIIKGILRANERSRELGKV